MSMSAKYYVHQNGKYIGALDRLRMTTPAGSNTFDAGKANIFYEG